MKNKRLKGYKKSRHFLERQKQRNVSDDEIVEALKHGSHIQLGHDHRYVLGTLTVTVDFANLTLITVHPGDPSTTSRKILTPADARKLRSVIDESLARELQKSENDSDAFLQFVQDNAVKKI